MNGWGISHSGTSPWWVSNEGTDTSTLYNVWDGREGPADRDRRGRPDRPGFQRLHRLQGRRRHGPPAARFIFATEDGEIYGWNGVGTTAIEAADTADAIYLGLAIGNVGTANFLYAANFHAGTVDVFDGTFNLYPRGDFTDPTLPEATPRSASRRSAAESTSPTRCRTRTPKKRSPAKASAT